MDLVVGPNLAACDPRKRTRTTQRGGDDEEAPRRDTVRRNPRFADVRGDCARRTATLGVHYGGTGSGRGHADATSANATKLRIRLIGIDAPEIAHHRNPGQPFGLESRRYLERLTLNRPVRLEMFGPDRFRRFLAVVWTGETNVNI